MHNKQTYYKYAQVFLYAMDWGKKTVFLCSTNKFNLIIHAIFAMCNWLYSLTTTIPKNEIIINNITYDKINTIKYCNKNCDSVHKRREQRWKINNIHYKD